MSTPEEVGPSDQKIQRALTQLRRKFPDLQVGVASGELWDELDILWPPGKSYLIQHPARQTIRAVAALEEAERNPDRRDALLSDARRRFVELAEQFVVPV
jgi:hypothetical protein